MTDNEKNLIFVAVVLLGFLVVVGISVVDSSLSNLMLPEEPYSTIGLGYEHGITVSGPNTQHRLKARLIAKIENEDRDLLQLNLGPVQLRLPLVVRLFSLEPLRDWVGTILTN